MAADTWSKRSQYEPNQTQNDPNQAQSEFTPKGAEIPTGELLGILKPGTNFTPTASGPASTFCWGMSYVENYVV